MNTNTGKLYASLAEARADLQPDEKPEDVVEVIGTRSAVEELARAVQQARAVEKRRAANNAARRARRANRS